MARLRTLSGPLTGRVFPVQDGNITIGRDLDNSLRLPVAEVSRHHAVLTLEGDAYQLRDLGSTNGTYVNGQRVAETRLRHGDRIRFGPIETLLETEADTISQPPPRAPDATVVGPAAVISSSSEKTVIPALVPAATPAPPAAKPALAIFPGKVKPRVALLQPTTAAPAAAGSGTNGPADAKPKPISSERDAQPASGAPGVPERAEQPPAPGPERVAVPPARPSPDPPLKKTVSPLGKEIKLRLGPTPPPATPKTERPPAKPETKGSALRPAAPEPWRPSMPSIAASSLGQPAAAVDLVENEHPGAVAVLEPIAESLPDLDAEIEQPRQPLTAVAPPPRVPPVAVGRITRSPARASRWWVAGSAVLLPVGLGMFWAGYPLDANGLKFLGLILASAGFWGLVLAPWYARSRDSV